MNQPLALSLEQEFKLRTFADQVKSLSREQAQEYLLDLYELMMRKENMYKHFLNESSPPKP